MSRFIRTFLLCFFCAVSAQAQTATVNWNFVHQQIQGFGAYHGFVGTAMNPYDNLFFNTLGYSLLRTTVPLGPGGAGPYPCDSVQPSCATDGDSVTDITSCVANGCSVWAVLGNPPAEYNSSGTFACTINPALKPASYGAMAAYMSNFIASLKNYQSVPLVAMSVQNEPDNNNGGCQMSAAQMDTFIKSNLGPTLNSAGQTSTSIMMPEVEAFSDYTAWADTCMNDSSCAPYVGINAFHDYGNAATVSNPYSKLFWETEVSDIGGPSPVASGCPGNIWCPGISDALMWATIVSNYLNDGVGAWHYFWYVDNDSTYGNDANVALVNPAQSPSIAIRTYAIANWAKFVRPGYYRIDSTFNPQSGVYVTAFQNTSSGSLVIVAVNTNGSNVAQTFSLANAPFFSSVTPWVTSSTLSLVQQSPVTVSSNSFNFALPASSIVSFVGSASAGAVTINPSSLGFGNVVQHTTSSGQTTTVTNSSGSTITLGLTTFMGANPSDFGTLSNTCTGSLANGNSCTVTVNFTPSAAPGTAESATMDVSFTGASGSPLAVSLSGTSIAGGNAHYYVSYAHGSDSNNGTSKASPWQHAPGMNGCSSNCNITPNPGDQIILEGCVTWPNAAFSWTPVGTGSSGNTIYYGVDKTWWDSTVSGCASAWNRPVFNLGGVIPSDSLYRIMILSHSYLTLDNFEVTGMLNVGSSGNGGTDVFDWGDGSESGTHVQNMYVHGVINKYFSVGTGNLASGQSIITNYVPLAYSPFVSGTFLAVGTAGLPCTSGGCNGGIQLQTFCNGIPEGNSTPTVTAITGSNPYTITYTNTAGGNSGNFTGCTVEVGNDYLTITGGTNGPTTDDIMQNNVIDMSDNAEWQMNPNEDCGLTESNNNFCVGVGTVDWRLPNVWRNNVIRNVASVAVAECQEWSGNLIEYLRLSINPTAHTNVIECEGFDNPVNGASLFYNNVIRHTNSPNPNTPTGRTSVGLGNIGCGPDTGNTCYIFNNVMYDTLQNAVIERQNSTSGSHQVTFSNSGDCGPSWELTHVFSNPLFSGDTYYNNYCATTNATPLDCTGLVCATNLFPTPTAASAAGYTENQTYAYSPPTGTSVTVGAGSSIASFCAAINSAQSAAGSACLLDTTYGPAWNMSTHQVTGNGRTTITRPSTPSIGAYEFGSGPPPTAPNPPTGLMATVTAGGGGIALISHTSAQYAGANNYSTTGINTVGATLLVAGTCSTSGNAPTVSDSQHNVWQTTTASTGGFTSQIVYAYAPSTNASDVFSVDQVTPGATGSSITVAAFSGTLSTSSVLDGQSAHNTAANSATVQPGSISPAQAAELFFTNVCSADTGTTSLGIDSSFSVLDNHNPTSAAASATSAYLIPLGSSIQNPTWTDNFSGNWLTSSMASFK